LELNLPLSRKQVRTLTVASSAGLMIGAAFGAAYLGGTLTREAQIRSQAQTLLVSDTNSSGSDHLLKAQAVSAKGFSTPSDDLDRRAIALVMRHDTYNSPLEVLKARRDAQRTDMFAAMVKPGLHNKATSDGTPIVKASLDMGLLKNKTFDGTKSADPFALQTKSKSDLDCLTQAVYYEARGETDAGQRAVAQVILNRVRHPAYPKTICNVVYEGALRSTGCQFSFTCNGVMSNRIESWSWKRARAVAEDALDGYVMKAVGMATHFHTTNVNPAWAPRLDLVGTIGTHVFYQFRGRAAQMTVASNEIRASDQPISRLKEATAQTPAAGLDPVLADQTLVAALTPPPLKSSDKSQAAAVQLEAPITGQPAQDIAEATAAPKPVTPLTTQ
jgi:spore germination cell wall hydrolase CwlJ-like protein